MTYPLAEPRTNQTVVSLLDRFKPPAPNGLSRTLPVLKWGALVFLEIEGWLNVKLFRVLLYAVQEHNLLKFAEIYVAILDDRLFFCVFTVIFINLARYFLVI